jgi:hypothetical protein
MFLLTNHAISDVPPLIPRIVERSVPIVFSRTTATKIQGSANRGRRSSFLVKSEDPPPLIKTLIQSSSGIRTWAFLWRDYELSI